MHCVVEEVLEDVELDEMKAVDSSVQCTQVNEGWRTADLAMELLRDLVLIHANVVVDSNSERFLLVR
eukprot:1969947-Pleurochrysis_carterae.AAC.4